MCFSCICLFCTCWFLSFFSSSWCRGGWLRLPLVAVPELFCLPFCLRFVVVVLPGLLYYIFLHLNFENYKLQQYIVTLVIVHVVQT